MAELMSATGCSSGTAGAFIFDAANTILANPSGFSPRNAVAQLLDLPSEEYVRNLVYTLSADQPGLDGDAFARALVVRATGRADAQLAHQVRLIWEKYNAGLALRPDAVHVLAELRRRGKPLALVPNCTPFFHELFQSLQLDRLFDVLVASCDIGLLKPDPRIFLAACQRLGTEPATTCVVGDKVKTDILGGVLAGCMTVLLETRYRTPVTQPKLAVYAVIAQLTDLLSLPFLDGQTDRSH